LIFNIQDDRLAGSAEIGCRNLTASHNPGKLTGVAFGSKYILDEWNKLPRACAHAAINHRAEMPWPCGTDRRRKPLIS
jgi:hypothetical protein